MESSAAPRFTRILLTGPPGIGKTTVCKKLVPLLAEAKIRLDGFYTEEVRSPDKNRIGFDVVSLSDSRSRRMLARTTENLTGNRASKARVGNYHVFVDEFEAVALPVFDSQPEVLLIDEIGKMELFSGKFKHKIEKVFFAENPEEKRLCVIATIPQRHKVPRDFSAFFEHLHEDESCKVLQIDRRSRDELPATIVKMVETILGRN